MLLRDFGYYDGICHGSYGDTDKACGAADYIGVLLGKLDWCWGREGEPYAAFKWHRCEITSFRFSPALEGQPGYGS